MGLIYSKFGSNTQNDSSLGDSEISMNKNIKLINENVPSGVVEHLENKPVIKDGSGNIIVKILQLDSQETNLTHVVSDDELYLLKVNPRNKSVVLMLEVTCKKTSNGLSFGEELLVSGKNLSFDFGFCTFEGVIISIDDESEPIN